MLLVGPSLMCKALFVLSPNRYPNNSAYTMKAGQSTFKAAVSHCKSSLQVKLLQVNISRRDA